MNPLLWVLWVALVLCLIGAGLCLYWLNDAAETQLQEDEDRAEEARTGEAS